MGQNKTSSDGYFEKDSDDIDKPEIDYLAELRAESDDPELLVQKKGWKIGLYGFESTCKTSIALQFPPPVIAAGVDMGFSRATPMMLETKILDKKDLFLRECREIIPDTEPVELNYKAIVKNVRTHLSKGIKAIAKLGHGTIVIDTVTSFWDACWNRSAEVYLKKKWCNSDGSPLRFHFGLANRWYEGIFVAVETLLKDHPNIFLVVIGTPTEKYGAKGVVLKDASDEPLLAMKAQKTTPFTLDYSFRLDKLWMKSRWNFVGFVDKCAHRRGNTDAIPDLTYWKIRDYLRAEGVAFGIEDDRPTPSKPIHEIAAEWEAKKKAASRKFVMASLKKKVPPKPSKRPPKKSPKKITVRGGPKQ